MAVLVASCAGLLLAGSLVVAVRHSPAVEAPEIPRTMIASYHDYSLGGT